jgi:hypothetical protein
MIIARGSHVCALVRTFDFQIDPRYQFNPRYEKQDERIILISTNRGMLFYEGAKLAHVEKDPSVSYAIYYYDNKTGTYTGERVIINKRKHIEDFGIG